VNLLLDELRLDVRTRDAEAAYVAGGLHAQTREFGREPGDRSCLALAIQLGMPAVTADREWKKVKAKGLKLQHIR
jgi:PIN domain nuclease of toxin-antitoxin system